MTDIGTIDALPGLNLEASYEQLPERFFAKVNARKAKAPELVGFNEPLARELGMDIKSVDREKIACVFSGNDLPGDGTLLSMAYSGHQFGHFNATLGDGRAGLVGEVIDINGRRRDIQLKGSGPTPFSRSGDGLAALGPVMREYVVSEAMAALGVPTTRSLAIVLTGDFVYRERLHPGAVLARVADSHLRIGTFQYFAARGDREGLVALTEYAIDRHYPELKARENPPLELLEAVIDRQAYLVVKWMSLGFIHGVMNTDNMTISGETIDYGPCAFMDHYDHNKVFSSIDQHGRYAYGAQPQIAQWNLARLAETLIPLIDTDEEKAIERATSAIQAFAGRFTAHWREVFGRKFGFESASNGETAQRSEVIRSFLTLMQIHKTDFTSTFAALGSAAKSGFEKPEMTELSSHFNSDPLLDKWLAEWRGELKNSEPASVLGRMKRANPVYIPRNHLVEEAIRAGEDNQDYSAMEKLLQAVLDPFARREGQERYALPPRPGEEITQTFCGT